MTELTDLSETDANNTLITGANIAEGCPPSGINNAIRNMAGLIRRAFKTSIFRLRDSTDQTKLLAFDLSELTTATTRTIKIPDADGSMSTVPRGHIYGLTLSNNSTDASNDIDIAAGEVASSDTAPVLITLASGITKRLDAAWAVGTGNGGLDTGSIADTTYHLWLIQRSDTGVVDALFSTSATSPTMPTSYDRKRRIGAILRVSGAIVAFTQIGDEFIRSAAILDVDVDNPGTSAVLRALSVPLGVSVRAIINAGIRTQASSNISVNISSPYASDQAPSSSAAPLSVVSVRGAVDVTAFGRLEVMTNTSAEVRTRFSVSVAGDRLAIATIGWIDTRV